MSKDRRELILARIFAIMQGIKGVGTIARNPTDLPEFLRLASYLALIDGDENRPPSNIKVIGMMPGMMEMTPIIIGGLSTTPELLGPGLSVIRAALLPALLDDTALRTLITDAPNVPYGRSNGAISYEGLSGKLSRGAALIGADMQLHFSIVYILNPKEL